MLEEVSSVLRKEHDFIWTSGGGLDLLQHEGWYLALSSGTFTLVALQEGWRSGSAAAHRAERTAEGHLSQAGPRQRGGFSPGHLDEGRLLSLSEDYVIFPHLYQNMFMKCCMRASICRFITCRTLWGQTIPVKTLTLRAVRCDTD